VGHAGGRVCGFGFAALPRFPYAPDGDSSNGTILVNREPPLDLPRVLSVTRSATTGRLPLTLAGASTVPVPHCTTPYAQLGTR
jgi:hypothetical protein